MQTLLRRVVVSVAFLLVMLEIDFGPSHHRTIVLLLIARRREETPCLLASSLDERKRRNDATCSNYALDMGIDRRLDRAIAPRKVLDTSEEPHEARSLFLLLQGGSHG